MSIVIPGRLTILWLAKHSPQSKSLCQVKAIFNSVRERNGFDWSVRLSEGWTVVQVGTVRPSVGHWPHGSIAVPVTRSSWRLLSWWQTYWFVSGSPIHEWNGKTNLRFSREAAWLFETETVMTHSRRFWMSFYYPTPVSDNQDFSQNSMWPYGSCWINVVPKIVTVCLFKLNLDKLGSLHFSWQITKDFSPYNGLM